MRLFTTSFILLTLALAGCDQPENQEVQPPKTVTSSDKPAGDASAAERKLEVPAAETQEATLLVFEEAEMSSEPFFTRMLITDQYIRIDEGDGSDGYVLFDRLKGRIFSILHDSERILVVDPGSELASSPADLALREEVKVDDKAPEVNGVKPKHYEFYANDKLCYNVIALDGFLQSANDALIGYRKVLTRQQQETAETTPVELQTDCFKANYLYASVNYVSRGFPFEQWDAEGYRRTLVDFDEKFEVNRILFALPEGYSFFSLGDSDSTAM